MDYEKFYGKVWKQGNSLVVTVPRNIVKFVGFVEGNDVIVMIKKTL